MKKRQSFMHPPRDSTKLPKTLKRAMVRKQSIRRQQSLQSMKDSDERTHLPNEALEESEAVNYEKDHKIDLVQLTKLRELFESTDVDGNGELDEAEFVHILQPILSNNMSPRELQQLFLRVDANANGFVDWDEFSSYILLSGEQRQHENNINAQYIRQPCTGDGATASSTSRLSSRHPDYHSTPATCVLCNQRNGKYYTTGRDGTVKAWTGGSLALEQTLSLGCSWITDAVFMRNETRLAVCTMDKLVALYDVAGSFFFFFFFFFSHMHCVRKLNCPSRTF
ncbi:hypothetical protein DIPPA_24523 [Diplonema papillatum]|nr:hypothetical protein DIPPA_24523 [Diplonema papillatum]